MPRRQRRAPRRQATQWMVAALCLGLGSLFLMAWQTHRIHELQTESMQLDAELRFQRDELRRLQVKWYQATQREVVVKRAARELALHHPPADRRQVIAIGAQAIESRPAWLRSLAANLDRYGKVSGALADPGGSP